MTVNVSLGAARRTPAGFGSATGCKVPRCKAARAPKITQRVKCAASKDYRPDSKGATDATAPVQVAPPETHIPSSHSINPFLYSLFIHLRHSANLLSQHFGRSESALVLPSLKLAQGPFAWARILDSIKTSSVETAHTDGSYNGSQQIQPSRVPLTGRHAMPTAHDIYTRFWIGANLLRHMNFGGQPDDQCASSRELPDARADVAESKPSSPAPTYPPATPTLPGVPLQLTSQPLLSGPEGLRAVIIARLTLLWHAAMTWQQHAAIAALWRLGHAVGAADRARRNMPPPHDVPHLVIWGAAAAAVHAEESVALALAHTATAASAVAIPSTAAAAATTVIPAPHLLLLYHARQRLLAAAKSFLEPLRSLQSGCATHVLLRFLLFSSLNPQLRRDMLIHLDVLARRATQLAILQAQHEAWTAKNPAAAAAAAAAVAQGFRRGRGDRKAAFFAFPALPPVPSLPWKLSDGVGSSTLFRTLHLLQGKSSAGSSDGVGSAASSPEPPAAAVAASASSSSGAGSAHLSARWFATVFATEMQTCSRQLRCDAVGSPPDDSAAGGPLGQFDLRDLYRLIRMVEVAVEDLERYP